MKKRTSRWVSSKELKDSLTTHSEDGVSSYPRIHARFFGFRCLSLSFSLEECPNRQNLMMSQLSGRQPVIHLFKQEKREASYSHQREDLLEYLQKSGILMLRSSHLKLSRTSRNSRPSSKLSRQPSRWRVVRRRKLHGAPSASKLDPGACMVNPWWRLNSTQTVL